MEIKSSLHIFVMCIFANFGLYLMANYFILFDFDPACLEWEIHLDTVIISDMILKDMVVAYL
jgi:hypothetical protein